MDLVIEGRAFVGGKLAPWSIGIEKGKIREVRKSLKGEEHLDFGDMLILPAAIDPHVHFRDPGLTHKEDFGTGTLAAAFGGVSCVLDMPNTNPPTITMDDLKEKKESVAKKAWVDYGIFGAGGPSSTMLRIAKEVVGFKVFMGSSTGSLLITEKEDMDRIMANMRITGKVLSVHAEDELLLRKDGESNLEDHSRFRPPGAEVSAIEKLSRYEGVSINICHLSSREALETASATTFTKEITPHHLFLDEKNGRRAFAKINPPLRSDKDRVALYDAFMSGRIDMFATDHAPHTIEEKEQYFDLAPSGAPGVETGVPMLLALLKKGSMSLDLFTRVTSQRAAEVFGLNKGSIAPGKDADLMVVDPRSLERIKLSRLHSKCSWTLYEGFEAIFPHATFVRGRQVTENGGLVGERSGRDVGGR